MQVLTGILAEPIEEERFMDTTSDKSPVSRGRCEICGATVAKAGMTRHLKACLSQAVPALGPKSVKPAACIHLVVDDPYTPCYWLHLEARPQATLENLDRFLRRVWLECCGHLSQFEIGSVRYDSDPDDEFGTPSEPMSRRLSRVLPPGMTARYQYDFGSTTELRVRAMSEAPDRGERTRISLLSRNEEPAWACVDCGEGVATKVCTVCRYASGGWLCARCAPKHDCGDEAQLPVVNSPRTGVCGYTGAPC
jgi:hypothetical protein